MSKQLSYKTHILIGVRSNDAMTVIADWPHLPKQAEVQGKIKEARDGYLTIRAVHADINPAGERQWKRRAQAIRTW